MEKFKPYEKDGEWYINTRVNIFVLRFNSDNDNTPSSETDLMPIWSFYKKIESHPEDNS